MDKTLHKHFYEIVIMYAEWKKLAIFTLLRNKIENERMSPLYFFLPAIFGTHTNQIKEEF